jgi:hypothetical protein
MNERHNGRGPQERIDLEMGAENSGPSFIHSVRRPARNERVGPYRIPAGWGGHDGVGQYPGVRTPKAKRQGRFTIRLPGQKVTLPVSLLALAWVIFMAILTLVSTIEGWALTP